MEPLALVLVALVGVLFGAAAAGLYVWQRAEQVLEEAGRENEEARRQLAADTSAQEAKLREEHAAALSAQTERHEERLATELNRLALQEERRAQLQEELRALRHQLTAEQQGVSEERRQLVTERERLGRRADLLEMAEKAVELRLAEARQHQSEARAELVAKAGMSEVEARETLLEAVRRETRQEVEREAARVELEVTDRAEQTARNILAMTMQRVAGVASGERSTSVVRLPNDRMKGRIIGRDGRNIRAFETASGVDLVIDETPEQVTVSCFDPVRREIARRAMVQLVEEGRISPPRIEEVLHLQGEELRKGLPRDGAAVVEELGLEPLPDEINALIGALRYRTSFAQNQLEHVRETALLTGLMAAELGLDAGTGRLAGLLHDIGKIEAAERQAGHAVVGAEIAQRHGLPEPVVNAIAAHHDDVPATSPYAALVSAADALSGARPGARRDTIERHMKRLATLEALALEFPGVEQAWALQAGRELRVVVANDQVDDLGAVGLSRRLARAVEQKVQFPGQIRVTVIRELRAVDYAR